MRKPKTLLMFMLLTFSVVNAVQPAKANFSVTVTINDAYYGDLDANGVQDDIRVDISVVVSNVYVYTDVDIYLGITLPSGQEFWFLHSFTLEKQTYTGQLNFYYDLMHTALESGWYTANAVGFAQGEKYSYMDSHIFDPPGGVVGGDPAGFVTSY